MDVFGSFEHVASDAESPCSKSETTKMMSLDAVDPKLKSETVKSKISHKRSHVDTSLFDKVSYFKESALAAIL